MRTLRCAGGATGASIPPGMNEEDVLRALAIVAGRVENTSPPRKTMKTTTKPKEKTVTRTDQKTTDQLAGWNPYEIEERPAVMQVIDGPPIVRRELRQPKATNPDTYGLGEEFTR